MAEKKSETKILHAQAEKEYEKRFEAFDEA